MIILGFILFVWAVVGLSMLAYSITADEENWSDFSHQNGMNILLEILFFAFLWPSVLLPFPDEE